MRRPWLLALALAPYAAVNASAGISAPSSVAELTAQADVIVVGEPMTPPERGDTATAISVTRTLKGSATGLLSAAWPPASHGPGHSSGGYGLWFLASDGWGGHTVLPFEANGEYVWRGPVPLPRGDLPSTYVYSPGDPAIDKVVDELRAGVSGISGEDLSDVFWAVSSIRSGRLPSVFEHLEHAEEGHSTTCPTLRLIREWDAYTISRVNELLASGGPAAVPFGVGLSLYHVEDPSVVPALGALGVAADGVHDAAAYALRSIHSDAALPYLAALLDSPALDQRYDAMMGLASYANNELPASHGELARVPGPFTTEATRRHVPSTDVFKADPERYILFWKTWYRCSSCRTDSTPPTVQITSPASNSSLRRTIAISVSASDESGIAGVRVDVDGTPIGPEATGAPYSFTLDTTTLAQGAHVLTAHARDNMDNEGTGASVRITVDNTF